MTKSEIASYLVSLHTLLDAQTKGVHSVPSTSLAVEYEKHWALLKETIQKENEDETRQSERQRPVGSESGTDFSSRLSGSGSADGEGGTDAADVSRERI